MADDLKAMVTRLNDIHEITPSTEKLPYKGKYPIFK